MGVYGPELVANISNRPIEFKACSLLEQDDDSSLFELEILSSDAIKFRKIFINPAKEGRKK